MKRRRRGLWTACLFAVLGGLLSGAHFIPSPSSAETVTRPCVPAKPGERIPMDFRDTPVRDVARLVSCALELNLVFSPSTLGDRLVTVVAPKPVPAEDLLRILESGLRGASMVLERRGDYWVIRSITKKAQRPSKRRSSSGR